MKAYIEHKEGILWIPVDETVENIPLMDDKTKKPVRAITEKRVRCNIAITDYKSLPDAKRIASIIVNAIESD